MQGLPYNLESARRAVAAGRQDRRALQRAFAQFPRDLRLFRGRGDAGRAAEQDQRQHVGPGRAALFLGAACLCAGLCRSAFQVVRTIVWAVSIVGLVMVLLAAFGVA